MYFLTPLFRGGSSRPNGGGLLCMLWWEAPENEGGPFIGDVTHEEAHDQEVLVMVALERGVHFRSGCGSWGGPLWDSYKGPFCDGCCSWGSPLCGKWVSWGDPLWGGCCSFGGAAGKGVPLGAWCSIFMAALESTTLMMTRACKMG